MNWKNEATEKLRRYEAMCTAIVNMEEELKRLELESKGIRSAQADGVKVRGSQGRKDPILNNLIRKQELRDSLRQTKLWVDCTQRALEVLAEEERLLLRRMYIYPERGCLERLCGELGVEQSSIYRRRDAALQRFTEALYGYRAT